MATYQLLPTSPSHQSMPQAPIQQRKALSFAILILLVATATLITIIRFTVNPNLNGQTFVQPTNAFALQRAHMLAKQSHQMRKEDSTTIYQQDKQGYHFVNSNRLNTVLSRTNNNSESPRQIINLLTNLKNVTKQAELDETSNKEKQQLTKVNSILLKSNGMVNSNGIDSLLLQSSKLNSNSGQPDSVSPSSKSVTSLIADQRYEKDYRDDPVTMSTIAANRKKRKPKVIFDQVDLKDTEHMRIDKEEGCGEDDGAYADLLVLVNSAVFNFDARSAIRDTWGKFAVERGAFLYFLLGSTEDQYIQDRVDAEDAKHGDILQGAFIDDYYNLTLKTITMMRWVSQKCSKIRYVLKVDDDMMMNMQHACDFTEINPNFHKVIIGKLAKKWKPHRSKLSKWYVPYEAYNQTYFPNFVTGPAYFFTGDAAKPLYETSVNKTIPFYLEDVYMTGIVAEMAGIKRFNHAMMRNVHLKLDSCTFPRIMTSHKHKPNEIRELWTMVYSGKKCVKTNVITRTTPKAKVMPINKQLDSSLSSQAKMIVSKQI